MDSIIAIGSCGSCAARAQRRAALSCSSGGCTRRRCRTGRTGSSTGRSRRSALGPAEYVKLNLVPESPWPSRRLARFPSRRIVNHNHGLNNGSSQSLHGGGVLVCPIRATINGKRVIPSFEKRMDWRQVWNEDLDTHRQKLPLSPADQNNINVNEENTLCQTLTKKNQQIVL